MAARPSTPDEESAILPLIDQWEHGQPQLMPWHIAACHNQLVEFDPDDVESQVWAPPPAPAR